MPSYSESFGLVAIEAQAAGTPVLAAAVGGLPVAVRDGRTGFLVRGHDPADYARVLRDFADDADARGPDGRGRRPARAVLRLGHRGRRDGGRLHGRDAGAPRVAYARTMADAATKAAAQVIESVLKDAELEWESPAARQLRRAAPRHPQAVDDRLPARRPPLPLAQRLRHPPPRRERARRPPLAPGAQPPAVRRELRHRPARRHLPHRQAPARPPSPPRRSTACSARSWRRRTAASTPCWSWVSRPRSARSTRGGCRAASRRATWTRSRI